MDTQILNLEPHDDITSARDKMSWCQPGRVLLIWPQRSRVDGKPVPLSGRLDLVMLLRYSARIGVQLALVTRDPVVHSNARDLGIPVFKNTLQAEKRSWNTGRRIRWQYRPISPEDGERPRPDLEALGKQAHPETPAWLKSLPARLVIFTLGVLGVLAIAAALLPSAEIRLTPKLEDQEINLAVLAVPNLEKVRLTGELPARTLAVTVEGFREKPVTGSFDRPEGFASGEVVFTNMTGDPVQVPSGSVVRTLSGDQIRFEVTKGGDVPGGVGSNLSLPVRALTPGTEGNLPPQSLIGIEGDLGLSLTVMNPAPTHGGTNRAIPAPSRDDYADLHSSLSDSLQSDAWEEAQAELSPGDLLLDKQPVEIRTLETSYRPVEIEPSGTLSLRMRSEFVFWVVLSEDIQSLTKSSLEAGLPVGFLPVSDTLKVKTLSSPEADDEMGYRFQLQVAQQIQAQISSEQVRSRTIGQPPVEAAKRLSTDLALAGPPQIVLFPHWWPRLPALPFRIAVVGG